MLKFNMNVKSMNPGYHSVWNTSSLNTIFNYTMLVFTLFLESIFQTKVINYYCDF